MQLSGYGLLRILLLRTGVKIDSAAAHFQGFGVALARPWNTGVKISSVAAPFSWLRGGPCRAMGHLGEYRYTEAFHCPFITITTMCAMTSKRDEY
jgi:hypothetical protein